MSTRSTTAATADFDPAILESAGDFVKASGLAVDEVTGTALRGHLVVGPEHHTPWGMVHGGLYATVVESAASIGATMAVRPRGLVAVGLTNTTNFLRTITAGRLDVVAGALHQGRTHQLWRVDIVDETGRLVAHGELRLQNVAAP